MLRNGVDFANLAQGSSFVQKVVYHLVSQFLLKALTKIVVDCQFPQGSVVIANGFPGLLLSPSEVETLRN